MTLFNDFDSSKNLLPYDGTVNYYGIVCTDPQDYFEELYHKLDWKNDEAVIFGKHITTKRKVAWYGNLPFSYTYSGIQKVALPWIPILLELKNLCQQLTGETFNSCLANLYHDGNEGMSWHSDSEKDLEQDGAIASLTFGAERKFCFKHKQSKEKVDMVLENGSLLVMKDTTQTHWLHRLPPSLKIHAPRINLTFRNIVKNDNSVK